MPEGFVYLLFSDKDRKTYLGSTNDIIRRLEDHFAGKVIATKYRRPLKLVYNEEYNTLIEARKREKFLKTKLGRRELKKIFEKLKF